MKNNLDWCQELIIWKQNKTGKMGLKGVYIKELGCTTNSRLIF